MSVTIEADVGKLQDGLAGRVITAEHAEYDSARQLHNGMIDKRPGAIVECLGVDDIVAAVRFAHERDTEISVRGGGHNVAGTALTDGGVMIDLSKMRGVHVDPASRTGRVQGGALWSDVNRETQLHGLAVTGGVISTTGVAGLTLGGGLGWLMGKHGLATDNMTAAQVVTATGDVVTASDGENDDLYWGLRGGGGNFGVVPWFEFDLHPVGPIILAGLVAHPVAAGRDVLRFYRDYVWDGPDERTAFAVLAPAPDGSGFKLCAVAACHVGPQEQAEQDLGPLRRFGNPAMDMLGPMPYSTFNSMLDPGFPKGALIYWKSAFLSELSDEVIDIAVSQYEKCPAPGGGIVIEHFHGAVTRVPVESTAFPHRSQSFNLVCAALWSDPAHTEANTAWTRETMALLEPYMTDNRYSNYLSRDDIGDDIPRAAYGPNYERLLEVKRTWDPENVFHLNLNVDPT